jgi:hypothetical protein
MDLGINMEKPRICGYDCYTSEHIDREMTDEEYAQWLLDTQEEPTDETPSPD